MILQILHYNRLHGKGWRISSYRDAMGFAFTMLAGGLACLVHAVFPFLFTRIGSDCIRRLHKQMVENRRRPPERKPREAA